jgi:hypothetical protein
MNEKTTEVWKDIPGYEGYYQASNLGSVRSLGRLITKPSSCGGLMDCYMQGRTLKPVKCGNNGFLKVVLSKDGIHNQQLVHRLVALAFIPPIEGKPDVDHKDFNRLNNFVENLEWTEDFTNNRKLYAAGRMKNTFKSIGKIRCLETGTIYDSCKKAADSMMIPYVSLNYHVHGQKGMKSAGGYHFEFVNQKEVV